MTTVPGARPTIGRSLRPLWLIVAFYIICFVSLGVLQTAAALIGGPASIVATGVLFQWVSLASVVIATWIMSRRVEKLSWSTVGLGRAAAAPPLILKGAAFGAVTIGVASLLLLATHMMRIDRTLPGSWWGEAGHSTIVLLPAAFFEELFIRGYVFAVLRRASGWRLALIVTSAVAASNSGSRERSDGRHDI